MQILNKVPFDVGLNDCIFDSLHLSVAKMESEDRSCTLLFDEMSVEPALSYNQKHDRIDGFHNTGNDRKNVFADHAMVFMARGIRRKWKQPIAYYFVNNGMDARTLASKIKEIIRRLREIGLRVIATVSDQASSNTAAINLLMQETNRECFQENKENRSLGFCIDGEEVIVLYDPPHLLKCVRNNLLSSNAKFIWNKREQTASWNHVIELYELDVGDHDTRMLNKLTDAHIYPEKMKKMKVKVAAQVFSHRVSSIMRMLAKHGNLFL